MAKRGPQPKTGKMEPPAYSLCETVPDPPEWLSDIGRAEWMEKAEELRARGAHDGVLVVPGSLLRRLRCLQGTSRLRS